MFFCPDSAVDAFIIRLISGMLEAGILAVSVGTEEVSEGTGSSGDNHGEDTTGEPLAPFGMGCAVSEGVSAMEMIFLGTTFVVTLLFLGRIIPFFSGDPRGTRISFSSSSGLLRTIELTPA